MHKFLRSIGFLELNKNEELYTILEDVIKNYEVHETIEDKRGNEFAEFRKDFGENMGICVCGDVMNGRELRIEYYYPYFLGSDISTYEPIELEECSSKTSYSAMCDDIRLGVTLIFYVDNVMDVLKEKKRISRPLMVESTVLSGLGVSGKILLPVMKTEKIRKSAEKKHTDRMQLIQQAREGNPAAMEHLSLREMDTYSSVHRRARTEDVLSIVESSMIPYGVESDQYIVIGEIENYYPIKNTFTGEKVWILSLDCNRLKFDVCINEKDLYGEPEIGRRFKGRVWMQGYLNF